MTFNLSDNLEITCNGEQMEQLTKWGKPGARMGGVRGRPAYGKWLRDEKRRIKEDDLRDAKIVKHPERPVVSLWVNERCWESTENSYKKIRESVNAYFL